MHTLSSSIPPIESHSCLSQWTVEPESDAKHTAKIQKAVDACSAAGGGTVRLRPGEYYSGTITLRDNVTLHLERGARLTGSTEIGDYRRREGFPGARLVGGEFSTALIFAERAENIGLTGEGVLDGSGESFWKKKESLPAWIEEKKESGTWIPSFEMGLRGKERPRALVLFANCKKVRVELAHIQNSPAWTIHLAACVGASLRGITLRGAVYGSNTDGIDIDACSDVVVEDCDIFTGDDAIAIKNTGMWDMARPSRNIAVRRCRLRSTTHGFTVGTETRKDFEEITLEDSQIEPAGEYGTMTGIGLSILDGAALRKVRIHNVSITGAVAPIHIRLGNVGRGQEHRSPGSISDLELKNISIVDASGNCLIAGLRGHPLSNIKLSNVHLEFSGKVNAARVMTSVPEMEEEFPPSSVWRYLPAFGFYCRHIDGLSLSDLTLVARGGEARPGLWLKDVAGFTGSNVRATELVA